MLLSIRNIAIFVPLALCACASGAPVGNVAAVPASRFENVQGEASLTVRTYVQSSGDTRNEVLGARCQVMTSLYQTEITTPSRLLVPNFGPQSPELTISCKANELSGQGTARIVTSWRYPPGYYPGTGLYGGYGPYGYRSGLALDWGYGGGAVAVSDYPNVNIMMR